MLQTPLVRSQEHSIAAAANAANWSARSRSSEGASHMQMLTAHAHATCAAAAMPVPQPVAATPCTLDCMHAHFHVCMRRLVAGPDCFCMPLVYVCVRAYLRLRWRVSVFVCACTDPFPPPLQGLTALHIAAERGHDKVVTLLLLHGASCAAVDRDSNTPLHLAAAQVWTGGVNRLCGAASMLLHAAVLLLRAGYLSLLSSALSRDSKPYIPGLC
eukprot:364035-Chlamydomonas_euryale.AAC.3